jgi:hypothetical protein
MEGEGVTHGVQHMHPGQIQAVDRRADRHRPGGHDQAVIAQLAVSPRRRGHGDLLGGRVDRSGGVFQQQPQASSFQVAVVRWANDRQSATSPDR